VVAPRRELDERQVRLAAADLLSRRPWTGADLTTRLRRRGAPPAVAEAVVADLARRGYVDDAAFALHWVTTRAARGYGATRLRAELRARGVATRHIQAALAVLGSEDALDEARAVARRRLPALRRVAPERVAVRLRDHLLRRGYAISLVARVVREMTGVAAED
jgi:regulatory protein